MDNKFPFGVIKIGSENIDYNKIYETEEGKIKISMPDWIN